MSPEQLQGKEADARSDLFSFGCVLYEMLTGKRAFEGESAASVIAAILEREPAPLDGRPAAGSSGPAIAGEGPGPAISDRARSEGGAHLGDGAAAAISRGQAEPPLAVDRRGDSGDRRRLGGWAVVALPPAARGRPACSASRSIRPRVASSFLETASAASPYRPTAGPPPLSLRATERPGCGSVRWMATTARLIAGTEGAAYPFWSPDSKSIAFFAGSKLQRVDLQAGRR